MYNDPLSYTDPTGHEPEECSICVFGEENGPIIGERGTFSPVSMFDVGTSSMGGLCSVCHPAPVGSSAGSGNVTLDAVRKHELTHGVAGLGAGTIQAIVPGLSLVNPKPPSRTFEFFRGAGEFATGCVQIICGIGGNVGGAALDTTGVGALVGVPIHIASVALMAQGGLNVGAGAATIANAMSMSGSGSGQGGGSPGIAATATDAERVANAKPVGSALKEDAAHRSASFVVNDIPNGGQVFKVTGGDGVQRTLIQTPGELNGVSGRYEWIIDDPTGNLTHQMFVSGGRINGIPIRP